MSLALIYGVNPANLERSLNAHRGHVSRVIDYRDTEVRGLWNAWRHAAEIALQFSARREWILMLPDDAIPVAPSLIDPALDSCPTDAACLYTARKEHVKLAEKTGANWINCPGGAWGICLAFRREALVNFLAWEEKNVPRDYPHDDGRVSMWRIANRRNYAILVPGLYDHDNRQSVLGHSNIMKGRRAAAIETRSTVTYSPEPFPEAPDILGTRTTRTLKAIR